ncbi:DMT family transporter [Levilactobacillus bambusae]|uniref:EamA family transporter n=1 Tax=Levilactobacillus bambusae TaxID=2024736 RepID=A0A2V1MW73_9LACO|nr:DMT family transporter [Levilactobacillus bambusae]PWF99360.1 EamA family transporter [Levilactobacillus bambusae]
MKKTIIYIILSTIMFSSMEIALKMANGAFNPIQLNLIRFCIGGIVLLPIARQALKSGSRRLTLADWGLFFITGFVCVIVSMTLYELAIMNDEASTVAVLFSCNPVFALIFSYLMLHERLGRANLIAVVVSIVGLVVIVNPAHLTNLFGMMLAVLSALTFGFYSIVSRYGSLKRHLSGTVMTCYTFIAGTIELFLLVLLTHVSSIANWMSTVSGLREFANIPVLKNVSLHYFWLLFFIGVCVTGGGFAFYFLAMETAGVSAASLVFFIKPALAPVLAMAVLGEKISLTTTVGIVIIVLGSIITFMGNRVKTKESQLATREAKSITIPSSGLQSRQIKHGKNQVHN